MQGWRHFSYSYRYRSWLDLRWPTDDRSCLWHFHGRTGQLPTCTGPDPAPNKHAKHYTQWPRKISRLLCKFREKICTNRKKYVEIMRCYDQEKIFHHNLNIQLAHTTWSNWHQKNQDGEHSDAKPSNTNNNNNKSKWKSSSRNNSAATTTTTTTHITSATTTTTTTRAATMTVQQQQQEQQLRRRRRRQLQRRRQPVASIGGLTSWRGLRDTLIKV